MRIICNSVVGVILMVLGSHWLVSSWEQGLALVLYSMGLVMVVNWGFLK